MDAERLFFKNGQYIFRNTNLTWVGIAMTMFGLVSSDDPLIKYFDWKFFLFTPECDLSLVINILFFLINVQLMFLQHKKYLYILEKIIVQWVSINMGTLNLSIISWLNVLCPCSKILFYYISMRFNMFCFKPAKILHFYKMLLNPNAWRNKGGYK